MEKILILSVKKKWFDLIKSGKKKEEYRTLKEYWIKRLGFKPGYYKGYTHIEFRNGYGKNVPKIKVELVSIEIGFSNKKNIDDTIKYEKCFILKLGKIYK